VKSGTRALGVACSDGEVTSTLAGAVVRADRVVDGFVFGTCTVGGLDATDTLLDCFHSLDRPDVRYLLLSGVAPAWFNLFDLSRIHEATGRPVVSVSFEESEGLAPALRREFADEALARRLSLYESLPERTSVSVGAGDTTGSVFVRSVGLEPAECRQVVREFTPEGGRPEPIRVARLAARAERASAES
jgi:endonuclease V-like protein UPF0215 family